MSDDRTARSWDNYPTGALREAAPIPAPTLEVKPRGLERKVDLRADMPPIVDQNPLNSCNACTIVAALEYFLRKDQKQKLNLSILFLYYNARKISRSEKKDDGVLSAHAMAGLMAYGVCEEKLWPYVPGKRYDEPPQRAYADAKRFEAAQYARLPSYNDVKALLNAAVPVTIGTRFPGKYYQTAGQTGRMTEYAGGFDLPGPGHSLLIVGYDDDDKSWLVRNSWGEKFGDRGYMRVPYVTMQTYVWHEDIWAVGALEKVREKRLFGGGANMQQDMWRETLANAPEQHMAALEKLKEDLRRELSQDVDAAKDDMRRRIWQEPAQQQQPVRFGDAGGSSSEDSSDRLQRLKDEMRDDQQRDLDDAKRAVRDRLRRSIDDDGKGR